MPTESAGPTLSSALRKSEDGVVVAVRLTPKSGRDAVGAPKRDADGAVRLRVSVTAPPADNLANEALVALMARTWKIRKSAITIVGGARGREKKLLIRGDSGSIEARIGALPGDEHD